MKYENNMEKQFYFIFASLHGNPEPYISKICLFYVGYFLQIKLTSKVQ